MKRILLIGALAMAAVVSSYAQGSVLFANSGSTSRVWWEANPGIATTWVPVGDRFTVELVYAPDGTPTAAFDAAATRVGATTTFGPQGGLFSGGGRTVQSITPAGGFGLFQVRVWETAYGTDYRSAFLNHGCVGTSQILRVDTGDPTTIPPGTPTPLTSAGLTPFVLTSGGCAPEPSVNALGIVSLVAGAACFLFCRRGRNRATTLLLLLGFIALGTVSGRAQGSVNFGNAGASRVWVWLYPGTATTWIPAGNQFTVELVYAPDGTPTTAFDTAATRVGASTTFFSAGLFAGGGRTVQTITPAGGFGLFQVRVWETAYGSDYRTAILNGNGCVGTSQILRVDTGDPTTVPPGTPTPLTSAGLSSFVVTNAGLGCIPEPSVVVLGVAAAAALLFFRTRLRK